jgi:FkbM family methyltransferase
METENMRDSLLDRITERESYLPKLAEELNATGLPLILYGAGKYASVLYENAGRYGLRISDVAITSLSDNAQEFMGYKVQTISEALSKHDRCNVLIAFQDIQDTGSLSAYCNVSGEGWHEFENYLKGSGKVSSIYLYGNIHSQYYENLNIDYSFIENNQHTLEHLYHALADNHSRDVLAAYYNLRISGKTSYIKGLFSDDQYFPDFIKLRDGEIFVDCGAYDGNTIKAFIKHMGDLNYSQIYAFEPDARNFSELTARGFDKLTAIQKGVYHKKTTLRFAGNNGKESSFISSGDCEVEVDTIDNILQGDRATYIKMDVEGTELSAIEGARETIIKHKPKLAISVYHKVEDLITLPQKILEYVPEYRIYLRSHRPTAQDTVLYCLHK